MPSPRNVPLPSHQLKRGRKGKARGAIESNAPKVPSNPWRHYRTPSVDHTPSYIIVVVEGNTIKLMGRQTVRLDDINTSRWPYRRICAPVCVADRKFPRVVDQRHMFDVRPLCRKNRVGKTVGWATGYGETSAWVKKLILILMSPLEKYDNAIDRIWIWICE